MREKLRSEKGSIMVETVFSCIILSMFFIAMVEVISLVSAVIDVNKIAREGAREACLAGSTRAGYNKAMDCSRQYFGRNKTEITLDITNSGGQDINVVCYVNYPHQPLKMLGDHDKVVNISAQACYPWWDENL